MNINSKLDISIVLIDFLDMVTVLQVHRRIFFFYVLIGGKLLYNVVLVSDIQLESAIIIHYIYIHNYPLPRMLIFRRYTQ